MATNTERSRRRRERLRHRGMKPIQIWVPDPDSAEFAAEAHRQSSLADRTPDEIEVMDLMEDGYDELAVAVDDLESRAQG